MNFVLLLYKLKYIFIFLLFFSPQLLFSQVSIGTNAPSASAILELNSSSKGFLPPRIALNSITDVSTINSPTTGLLIYNTATAGTAPNNVFPGYFYFDGTKWQHLFNPSSNIVKTTIPINSASPSGTTSGTSTISNWSTSYTSIGGTVEIRVNFTAFSGSNNSQATFKLLRDGNEIDNGSYYLNLGNTHTVMPDLYAILPNETGSHTYAIQIGTNVIVDVNDIATITITETKFN